MNKISKKGKDEDVKANLNTFELIESIPIKTEIINDIVDDINIILEDNESFDMFGVSGVIEKYVNELKAIKGALLNILKRKQLFDYNIGDLESQIRDIKKDFEDVYLKYLKSKEILQTEVKKKKKGSII